MTDHHLKAWSEFWINYASGLKPWSIRRNDRDFDVGDWLILGEWKDEAWTGRVCALEVIEVFRGLDLVADGHVVLSLGPVGEVAPEYLDANGRYHGPPPSEDWVECDDCSGQGEREEAGDGINEPSAYFAECRKCMGLGGWWHDPRINQGGEA